MLLHFVSRIILSKIVSPQFVALAEDLFLKEMKLLQSESCFYDFFPSQSPFQSALVESPDSPTEKNPQ